MIKGVCPNCGREYFGWALQNRAHQKCDVCGIELCVYDEELEGTVEGMLMKKIVVQQARNRLQLG